MGAAHERGITSRARAPSFSGPRAAEDGQGRTSGGVILTGGTAGRLNPDGCDWSTQPCCALSQRGRLIMLSPYADGPAGPIGVP
jgi:hypothetical protein